MREARESEPQLQLSSRRIGQLGFTLNEVVIGAACASIMFGAIIVTSLSLQRTFRASDEYASLHAGNQRLMDSIATDLRKAVTVGARRESTGVITVLSGSSATPKVTGTWISLLSGTTFVFDQLTVYKGVSRSGTNYRQRWSLRATSSGVTYSTGTGVLPRTRVEYLRAGTGDSESIVRHEIAPSMSDSGVITTQTTSEVVYRESEDVDIDLEYSATNSSVVVRVYYPNQFSRTTTEATGKIKLRSWGVVSSDNIMIRNPRED